MTIDAAGGRYECAVDVSAPSGIPVQYREVRNLDATLFTTVAALGPGQDGGTVIQSAGGSLTAFLTKFKPQSLTTDDHGLPR